MDAADFSSQCSDDKVNDSSHVSSKDDSNGTKNESPPVNIPINIPVRKVSSRGEKRDAFEEKQSEVSL